MKAIFATTVLALSFVTSAAQACAPAEAQMIGQVVGRSFSKAQAGDTCTYQVGRFRYFQESGVCGLSAYDAAQLKLVDPTCSVQIGQEVSGVIAIQADGTATLN